jgi:hypothetical protein
MENNMAMDLIYRLQQFLENEALSCSMDFGCVTPLYVYRMWGGTVAFEDIEEGLKQINLYDYR